MAHFPGPRFFALLRPSRYSLGWYINQECRTYDGLILNCLCKSGARRDRSVFTIFEQAAPCSTRRRPSKSCWEALRPDPLPWPTARSSPSRRLPPKRRGAMRRRGRAWRAGCGADSHSGSVANVREIQNSHGGEPPKCRHMPILSEQSGGAARGIRTPDPVITKDVFGLDASVQSETSNKIIQKGLAFGLERSGTVTVPGATSTPESRPAGCIAAAGLRC
jgi:hypothetical protein